MIDILKSLIKQFMPFAQEHIGFQDPPKLFLKQDAENASNPLGKTAYYDPMERAVTLYVTDRHPKDVLRSLGHELVHHKQNCDGKFDDMEDGDTGEGYAQTNPRLRAMEFEANSKGSMALRDFEDRLKTENTTYYEHLQKGEKQMSMKQWKNKEISTLLTEAWGFGFDLDNLNESGDPTGIEGDNPRGKKKAKRAIAGDPEAEGYQEPVNEEEEIEEAFGQAKSQPTGTAKGYTKKKCKDAAGERVDCDSPGATPMEESTLKEDSGEDEAWHQWKNEHADDDHIKEIEHHLRALKDDRDYERHGADDDRHEDEDDHELDEAGVAGRKDPRNRRGDDPRMRAAEGKVYTQKQVHEAFRRVLNTIKNKGNTKNG